MDYNNLTDEQKQKIDEWLPVLVDDEDWDHAFLFKILQYKQCYALDRERK